MNSSFYLTAGIGVSIGDLGLVERINFLVWVRCPWSDSTDMG